MAEAAVVDASAVIDLLLAGRVGRAVARRVRGHELGAPAHVDAEVLSGLGRLHRAGFLSASQVASRLEWLSSAELRRHPIAPLLRGAWRRRHNLRLVDALYVELAEQ